jgi:hypothetical protein
MDEANRPIQDINDTTGMIGIGSMPDLSPVAAFQEQGVRNLIDTKGFIAYHYRHTYNPDRASIPAGVNVNSVEANRYGVMFYDVRQVRVVCQNISMEHRLQSDSVYGFASAVVNVAGLYLDGDKGRVYVRPRDLIVPNPDITEQTSELLEYNPNGELRAKHRIKAVDYLASNTTRYEQGPDFLITTEGTIQWVSTGNRPSGGTAGKILTIVYWFSPVWIAARIPHTLRLLPSNPQGHGAYPRQLYYAPQQVIVNQNHLQDSNEQVDFSGLPLYSGYSDSANVTGGSL